MPTVVVSLMGLEAVDAMGESLYVGPQASQYATDPPHCPEHGQQNGGEDPGPRGGGRGHIGATVMKTLDH